MNHTPDPFEASLRRALAHVDPPPGLADRILEASTRLDAPRPEPRLLLFRPRGLRPRELWGSALAACLLLGALLAGHTEYTRARQKALAAQQFALSEQITSQTLAQARRELQRKGIALDGD